MNSNHPAKNVEIKANYLKGKKVWLAVTGSVACVETIGITRELLRYGAEVTIVANRAALELVGEKALELLSIKSKFELIKIDRTVEPSGKFTIFAFVKRKN